MNILPIVIFGGAAAALLFLLVRTTSRGRSISFAPEVGAEYLGRVYAHKKAARQLVLFVLTLIVIVPVFVEPLLRKSAMRIMTPLSVIHLGLVGISSLTIFTMYFLVTGIKNLPLHRLLAKFVVAMVIFMTITGFMLLTRIIH